MKSTSILTTVLSAFLIALVYAILRYNIFGNVPWIDLPIFVLNKAVALTIIILLFYDQIKKKSQRTYQFNLWVTIFVSIVFHILLSMVSLIPEYYEKFYTDNQFNVVGSLSVLFGIISFLGFLLSGILWIRTKYDREYLSSNTFLAKIKVISIIFISIHVFVMGIKGWLLPVNWPGYLFPISLISFVLLITTLFIKQK